MTAQHRVRFKPLARGEVVLARHVLEREPWLGRMARRERRIQLALSVPVGIVIVAGTWAALARAEPEVGPSLGLIVGVMFAVLWMMYVAQGAAYAHLLSSIRKQLRPRAPANPEEHTAELREEGVQLSNSTISTLYRWTLFDRVIQTDGYVAILMVWRSRGIEVQVEAFESGAAAAGFAAEAGRLMEAAQCSERQRVTAFLAENSVRCGVCRQDLMGLTQGVCPECGQKLSVMSVMSWAALQKPWWKMIRMRRDSAGVQE